MNIIRILVNFILSLIYQIFKPFRRKQQKTNKVVIYLKGGIGDFTFLIPILYSIKACAKRYNVHLVVSKNLFELVKRYNDHYKLCDQIRIIGTESDDIRYRIKSIINEVNYNLNQNYYVFFDAWPATSLMIKAISLFAFTNNKIGIENKSSKSIYNFPIYPSMEDHVVVLNAKVLDHFGIHFINKTLKIPIHESDKQTASRKIMQLLDKDITKIKPFIVLYPHTKKNNGKIKNWKIENYISLINLLVQDFNRIKILIMGSKNDDYFCQEIISGIYDTSTVLSLAGKTSLYEDCFIASMSDLFIGIDGGFTHLVNAFRIPSIVLWGTTAKNLYGAKNNYTINISSDNDSLQNVRSKDFKKCDQVDSLDNISPGYVVSIAKKILVPI